jgi:hypothetical protein
MQAFAGLKTHARSGLDLSDDPIDMRRGIQPGPASALVSQLELVVVASQKKR